MRNVRSKNRDAMGSAMGPAARAAAVLVGCALAGCALGDPSGAPATAATPPLVGAGPRTAQRLLASWQERGRTLVGRRPHGDQVVSIYRSSLELTGDLEGTAQVQSQELTLATGGLSVVRMLELRGNIFGQPGVLRLAMLGSGAAGTSLILSDQAGTTPLSGEGSYAVDAGAPSGVLEIAAVPTSSEVVLSFANQDEEGYVLAARQERTSLGGARTSMIVPLLQVANQHATLDAWATQIGVYLGPPWTQHADWGSQVVPPGASRVIDTSVADNVYTSYPAALSVGAKVALASGPARYLVRPLKLYQNQNGTPRPSYAFPARAADLLVPKTWWTAGKPHGDARGGQRYGHDTLVARWDGTKWTSIIAGQTGAHPSHHLGYGVPVYAMADGVVEECTSGDPDNPDTSDIDPDDQHVAGNHFKIRHGEELALYAHMRPVGFNLAACHVGAVVTAGEKLGEVGNTGTGLPHLHLDVTRDGRPLPLQFHGIRVVDRAAFDPIAATGPWTALDDFAIARPVPQLVDPQAGP